MSEPLPLVTRAPNNVGSGAPSPGRSDGNRSAAGAMRAGLRGQDFAAQEAALSPVQAKRTGGTQSLRAPGALVQRKESDAACSTADAGTSTSAPNASQEPTSSEVPAPAAATSSPGPEAADLANGAASCDALGAPASDAGACLTTNEGRTRSEIGEMPSEALTTCAPNAADAEVARLAQTLRRLADESDGLEAATMARVEQALAQLEAAAQASFATIGAARAKWDQALLETFEDAPGVLEGLLGDALGSVVGDAAGVGLDWALGEVDDVAAGVLGGALGLGVFAVAVGCWTKQQEDAVDAQKMAFASRSSGGLSGVSISVNGEMASLLMRMASEGTLSFGKSLGYLGAWRDAARSGATELETLGAQLGVGQGEEAAEKRGAATHHLGQMRELQMAHQGILAGLDATVTAVASPTSKVAAAGGVLAQKLEAGFLSFQMGLEPVFSVGLTKGSANGVPNHFDRSSSVGGAVLDFTPPAGSGDVTLAIRKMFATDRGSELAYKVRLVGAFSGKVEHRPGVGWRSDSDLSYFSPKDPAQGIHYVSNVVELAIANWCGR